jgi:translation initiation factor 1
MSIFAGTEFYAAPKCDRCEMLETQCQCPPEDVEKTWVAPEKQTAKISKQKRKKGKIVTVVSGLKGCDNDLPTLLKELKNECGAGGCVDNDTLEIQGDHRDRVAIKLQAIGYRIKRIGG